MTKSELRRRIEALEAEVDELHRDLKELAETVCSDLDRLEQRTVSAAQALSLAGRG